MWRWFSRHILSRTLTYPAYVPKYLSEHPLPSSQTSLPSVTYNYSDLKLLASKAVIVRKDTTMLDEILQAVVVIVKVVFLTLVAAVKALLPMGVLPRKSVKGQVVLITGSGSGLGRGMAIEFAKLGAKIMLWDINEKGNLETKQMLDDIGAEVNA
ncbi:hypothetical protein Q1695_008622 [Nippostrongylus brasiliensis]|nr:hypothetical protein Q1695_008622 [Nippostrongylus brasiliensis]